MPSLDPLLSLDLAVNKHLKIYVNIYTLYVLFANEDDMLTDKWIYY